MKPQAIEFEIDPNEAAGPLCFGMDEDQVRQRLGELLGASAPPPEHLFEDLGIRVHYGPSDTAEAFEFRRPASPTFRGHALLGQPFGELESWFASLDAGLKLEHSGLTSIRFGIRIYAASARKRPRTPVESVTVFGVEYSRRYIMSILPPPG